MLLRSLPFALAVGLLAGNIHAADEGQNPFSSILDGDEYERREKARQKSLAEAYELAADPDFPTVGMKVASRTDPGSFEKANIPVGAIVTRWENQKSWGGFVPRPLLDSPHELGYFDPDSGMRTATVEGGPHGARFSSSYRLNVAYLRGETGKLLPLWEPEIALACQAVVNDLDLAQTALHRAYEKGYEPDELTAWFEAIFARFSKDGAENEMEKFLSYFEDKPIPWALVPPLQDVLVSTGRIDFMQRIARESEAGGVFDEEVIARFLEWRSGETRWPNETLLSRAIANRGESLNGLFNSENDVTKESRQFHFGKEFGWRSRPGQRFSLVYSPDVDRGGGGGKIPQNFHYHLSISLFATGLHTRWGTDFTAAFFNVYDKDEPTPYNTRFDRSGPPLAYQQLSVNVKKNYSITHVETIANSLPGSAPKRASNIEISYIDDPALPDSFKKTFETNRERYTAIPDPIVIDLIRLGDEAGIFINGQCWLHQPTDPDPTRDLEFRLQSVGIEAYLHEQEIWAIKE